MKLFYQVILFLTRLELAIARSAPVRNPGNIEALEKDESKWSKELFLWEANNV